MRRRARRIEDTCGGLPFREGQLTLSPVIARQHDMGGDSTQHAKIEGLCQTLGQHTPPNPHGYVGSMLACSARARVSSSCV